MKRQQRPSGLTPNRRLAPEIETLFMMPSENLAYVTASTVREIARYGGDTSTFVTPAVQKRLAALAHPKASPLPHLTTSPLNYLTT